VLTCLIRFFEVLTYVSGTALFSNFAVSFFTLMLRLTIILILTVFSLTNLARGQDSARIYHAARVEGEPPHIDGVLSEEVWNLAEWSGDFTQQEPYEYAKPSQPTEFKILYGKQNLYVAIRCFDSEPDKIERRLTRRDNMDGDAVFIGIDSYNDKLTAFVFGVSAAGVKIDGRISNDNEFDITWNPVWYVKVKIDDKGWLVEMKIPYNQLRFSDAKEQVWGLELLRILFRKQETTLWEMVPRQSAGWVSRWGTLSGIYDINPKKEIALTPYVMGDLKTSEKEDGNPYATGTTWEYNAGLDGKIAVTNDLTLNFTVNPDFGQVEADPSVVNLTSYETFYEEKRPFFVEGSNIYNFPISKSGGPSGRDNLFYSRRIGKRPSYYPNLADGEYMKISGNTRILGAVKLSGKTKNGLSVGILESLTNKETAEIDNNGEKRKEVVEPFTNFFNARLQQDIKKGKTIIGGMITATNRFINDSTLEFLPKAAYTGGLDFTNFWNEKTYSLEINLVGSYITGTKEAILEQQLSSRRYYQRPDASHLNVDSTLTTLSGSGGTIKGGKIGGGNWTYGGRFSWLSPGLELNDMGYLRSADNLQQTVWVTYQIYNPVSIFRKYSVSFRQWSGWDFSGTYLWSGFFIGGSAQFMNYYTAEAGVRRFNKERNRAELRGGPAVDYPGSWMFRPSFGTNTSKKLWASIRGNYEWGDLNYKSSWGISGEISYRPFDAFQFSVEPGYFFSREDARYVDHIELENKTRYIMGALDQSIFVINLRLNFSITPDLSIQFWGQPFFFSGDYSNYKVVTDPGNKNYNDQFYHFSKNEIWYNQEDDKYQVCDPGLSNSGCDPETNPDYSFSNPDFSFYDLLSNFVIRWEYVPGSTVFFVWSHGQEGYTGSGEFNLGEQMGNLFDTRSTNVYLIKFSYRFSF